jgi:hypothetical protein
MAECGPLAPAAALARLETALSSFQVGVQADDTAALALRPARVSARTRPEHDASRSRSRAAQPQPQPQPQRGARFDG